MVLLRTFQNDKRDEWLEATVPLQSEHSEFEVILSSVSGGKVGDSIAVDDIILSSECVVDHSGTTLPNEVTTLTPTTHTATPTINPTSKNPPICEQGTVFEVQFETRKIKFICDLQNSFIVSRTRSVFLHTHNVTSSMIVTTIWMRECAPKSLVHLKLQPLRRTVACTCSILLVPQRATMHNMRGDGLLIRTKAL